MDETGAGGGGGRPSGRRGASDAEESGIRVGVDVGGTFTDVALHTRRGELVTAKVPTTDEQSAGVLAGIRTACDRAGIEPAEVEAFSHASTVGVNALLEREGAKTGLVTTAGFRDVLEIGRQTRPDLYDPGVERPDPLVPRRRRFEVDERASPEGVERPVTDEEIERVATALEACGVESVAVCLLHAYAHPVNERRLADGLRERLAVPVSASHEVLATFREYERTATTVGEAYVRPAIDAYLGRLIERADAAGAPTPRVLTSTGGAVDAATARKRAASTVLSGPAAGVLGAKRAAAATVEDGARGASGAVDGPDAPEEWVTVDMGGTSSDVGLVREGRLERTTDAQIAGQPIALPTVDVETVGAGGGSVAWVDDGGALRVGPHSAGAEPGPACYGRGGTEPTVTDAYVVLGLLGGDATLGGDLEIRPDAAREVLAGLADDAGLESSQEAAAGVYRIANATTTRAIRRVTVERGHDPRDFGLVAFGGAGPLHAGAIAAELEMGTVLVPLPAGVLSAVGLLDADERVDTLETHRVGLAAADPERIEATLADLAAEARDGVGDADAASLERRAACRYAGQHVELEVPVGDRFDPAACRERFHATHERSYGYRMDEPVDLVTLRVSAVVAHDLEAVRYDPTGDARVGTREVVLDGRARETPIYDRAALPVGRTLAGPAVCEHRESTTLVPPGWSATVRADGALVCPSGGASA